MTTTTLTPTATVPALTTDIAELVDVLTGFHPALDRAVAGLRDLLTADLTTEQTMGVIAALGGLADGHLLTLIALIVRQLGNPDANSALAHLGLDAKQALRLNGAAYAAYVTDDSLTEFPATMCHSIDPS